MKALIAKIKNLLPYVKASVITPKSIGEDSRRQEMILNIILTIIIGILAIFEIIIIINSGIKGSYYDGVRPLMFSLILIFYITLLIGSRMGHVKKASYILIGSYMAGALYCGYQWGVSLPATLLTLILVIQMSSILISTRFGLMVTLVSATVIILLGVHEYRTPEILNWRFAPINHTDFITYSCILGFISLLSWLSNREIEKSLKRARDSESNLLNEKESLEIKVEERTKEIREMQLKRMNDLSKVAEFGRLAQGLLHDLISPLSSVVLHMGKFKDLTLEQIRESGSSVEKITKVSNQIATYMDSVKYSMKEASTDRGCCINDEIRKAVSLLNYKARSHNVEINCESSEKLYWYGDPMKLGQIFSNLISNGIDACAETDRQDKEITINIVQNNERALLTFQDNGIGIDPESIQKIFDPFYTTKPPEHGTGIGLSTVKKIIEDIKGEIKAESTKNSGSVFTIGIPITK